MKSIVAALAIALLFYAPTMAIPAATGGSAMTDHLHDFDFLIGNWRVHHWLLKEGGLKYEVQHHPIRCAHGTDEIPTTST
jgi:hypothetical protein